MPQCQKCGKKGLFLKIEEDTGLCLACNERFAAEGKPLTAGIMEAKTKASTAKDPDRIRAHCRTVGELGEQLVALHERFGLKPSQELLDLMAIYRKMGEEAGGQSS
jgi:hypothetical protein